MSATRYAIALAPLIAILAFTFAILQLWTSFVAFRMGNWQFGLFYVVFGIGGIALAIALMRVRFRFGKELKDRDSRGQSS